MRLIGRSDLNNLLSAIHSALSHCRADNPRHKLVLTVPLFLTFGFLAGSDRQDFAKDLFARFRQRDCSIEDFAAIDINVLHLAKVGLGVGGELD